MLSSLLPLEGATSGLQRPVNRKLSAATSLSATSQFLVVLFTPETSDQEIDSKLATGGFRVLERPDLVARQRLVEVTLAQALELSDWPEVLYIFPASEELIAGVPLLGCPGSTEEESEIGEYVAAVGRGWPVIGRELTLTYSFSQLSRRVPESDVRELVARVLAEWAQHAAIRFTQTGNPQATRNLNFMFGASGHGDTHPFDGPGRVLGHSFYPAGVNAEPIAGDVHLDDDESWQTRMNPDLYSILLHEVGHALGLGHADRPGAVMYPYYSRLAKGLQQDDIDALKRLYPARTGEPEPLGPPDSPTVPVAAPIRLQAEGTLVGRTITLRGNLEGGTAPFVLTWTAGQATGRVVLGTGAWTIDGVAANAESTRVDIAVVDSAEARATATLNFTTPAQLSDTSAPTIAISSPSASLYATSASSIKVGGTARDNVGVESVTWTSSSGASGEATGTTSWRTGPIALLVGDNVLTFTARDAAGNSRSKTVTVTRR